jgi:D123
VLPEDEDDAQQTWSDSDSGIFSSNDNADDASEVDEPDVSANWRDIHESIRSTINELGGKAIPKLNWSAPKDATWISATNSLECRSPNDIYLLLKSSDFVTHDLEHPFDDCVDEDGAPMSMEARKAAVQELSYYLVLRKYFLWNSSIEFRCFVRNRQLIAICQRDLNHFEFLFKMRDELGRKVQEFFDEKLKGTFPDPCFVFDVYIPPPHERIWLIDINPWAQRTDPLIFSWLELLTMPGPDYFTPPEILLDGSEEDDSDSSSEDDSTEPKQEGADEEMFVPEFRLVRRDDPEAYNFSTQQYSAHKLPKDVVDASHGDSSELKDFAQQWRDLMDKRRKGSEEDSEAD